MKITALEEYSDFATLDNEKLFSKLKFHKLSRKGHDANPTNTTVSLAAASDEQR
jgi:hypothetical protein